MKQLSLGTGRSQPRQCSAPDCHCIGIFQTLGIRQTYIARDRRTKSRRRGVETGLVQADEVQTYRIQKCDTSIGPVKLLRDSNGQLPVRPRTPRVKSYYKLTICRRCAMDIGGTDDAPIKKAIVSPLLSPQVHHRPSRRLDPSRVRQLTDPGPQWHRQTGRPVDRPTDRQNA